MIDVDRLVRLLLFREDVSLLEGLASRRWWPSLSIMLGPILAALAWWVAGDAQSLPGDGRVMLAIFVVAAWYWITGVIPPFATGVLVIGLGALMVGYPAGLVSDDMREAGSSISSWTAFVAPGAAPVVILMLGGFVLSRAAAKHGLDRELADLVVRPFARSPALLVLGVMAVTAMFSMWVSNTATAAMMTTLIAPIAAKAAPKEGGSDGLRRAMILAVPVGANIGGMGTPIGTPPNAIAFGALLEAGIEISFLGWMLFAVPLVIVLLLGAWVLLLAVYRPWASGQGEALKSWRRERVPAHNWKQYAVAATFTLTVALWITSIWTKLPIGATALVPIVVFTATGILDRQDINRLEWDILLLVAGGLALGAGMENSGLASWMVGSVPADALPAWAVVAVLAAVGLTIATFMSNTAAANLIIPIGLGIAATTAGVSPISVGVAVALASSLAMSLPVSTPPNAIAFAGGGVRTTDFLRVGLVIGPIGIVLVLVVASLVTRFVSG